MYKRMQWIFGAAALTVALTACPEITEQDRQDNLIARDQTGTVITADGTEAEFDFKSGKDCFKLAYEDNFDYANLDELLAESLPEGETGYNGGKTRWYAQTDRNVHPDGVEVGDGTVKMKVKKVAADYKPDGAPEGWAPIANTLCGGLTYNQEVFYGVIEARIKMYKKEYSCYWPGFYTYAEKVDGSGDARRSIAGYEFEIFEPLTNNEIDQTTRWLWHGGSVADYSWSCPLEFETWITATVAWTPEKVAYYLNDELSYVFYNDNRNEYLPATVVNSVQRAAEGKPSTRISADNEYQLTANIPQRIILAVEADQNSGTWTGGLGATSVKRAPDGWEQVVYEYDWFRYYQYVGTEK